MPTDLTALLKPKEASALLGVSTSTLRWWRYAGKGPPVIRLESGTYRYQQEALLAYIEHGHVHHPCGKREESHVGV